MTKQEFDTCAEIAQSLVDAREEWLAFDLSDEDREEGLDVRLQLTYVDEDGISWDLKTGDASFDTDHTGWWGAGWLDNETDLGELAQLLLEEALDDYAEDTAARRAHLRHEKASEGK